jgi:hypothetical protein
MQLLDRALKRSLERYTTMLAQTSEPVTARRVVAGVYGAGVRLDPRRRRATR